MKFEIQDGVLYHLERDKTLRIVVPTDSRKELFDDAHSGMFGAHLRSAKIHSQLGQHYWWLSMRADINSWARACAICASRQIGKPLHPCLTPLPVGGPFDRVGVDVVQLPNSSKGNKYVVVFVDYLTKWPEVFPVKDKNSLTIARLLVEHIIPQHGVPSQLLSDRGLAFVSKIMFEVYNLLEIKKISTTAYHPQTDGLVERYNRTLIDMLSRKCNRQERIGTPNFRTFFLRIALVFTIQLKPIHFVYCMAGIQDFLPQLLLMHLWTGSLWTWRVTILKWHLDCWQLGTQQGQPSLKLRSIKSITTIKG